MRKFLVILGAVLMLVSPVSADSSWGPVVSYWNTSDASDGYGLGAAFSMQASDTIFVDFRVSWFDDLAEGNSDAGVSDIDLEIIPIELGISAIRQVSEHTEVYFGGGLGYYVMDGDVDTTLSEELSANPDNEFGLYGMAGFRITVADNMGDNIVATRISILGGVTYRIVSADEVTMDGKSGIDLSGGDLNGFGFDLGVMLHW
jgi:hypothetical protein